MMKYKILVEKFIITSTSVYIILHLLKLHAYIFTSVDLVLQVAGPQTLGLF